MAQPQRKPMSLESAKAVLAEVEAALKNLAAARDVALLRATDQDVARIDAEIEERQKARRTAADRVRLLEAEAERLAVEKWAKERAGLIARIEAKLEARDAAGAELAKHVAAADAAFLKVLALGREVTAEWPWQSSDLGAAMLAEGYVLTALRHEHRVGGRPLPGDATIADDLEAAFEAMYEEGEDNADDEDIELGPAMRSLNPRWRQAVRELFATKGNRTEALRRCGYTGAPNNINAYASTLLQ